MLTLNKLKSFLAIAPDNISKDDLLNACISAAVDELNGLVNRRLDFSVHTECISGSGTKFAYLKNYPVTKVTSIKIINGADEEYIIKPPDTISDSLMIFDGGIIFLRKQYVFTCGDMNILAEYESGYDTAEPWQPEFQYLSGDKVFYLNGIYVCKTGHTSAREFESDYWVLTTAVPAPTDLQKAVEYLAARIFYDSPAGKNMFAHRSESTAGAAAGNTVYKDIDIERIVNSYRKANI